MLKIKNHWSVMCLLNWSQFFSDPSISSFLHYPGPKLEKEIQPCTQSLPMCQTSSLFQFRIHISLCMFPSRAYFLSDFNMEFLSIPPQVYCTNTPIINRMPQAPVCYCCSLLSDQDSMRLPEPYVSGM